VAISFTIHLLRSRAIGGRVPRCNFDRVCARRITGFSV
jgi:hypothetical protein